MSRDRDELRRKALLSAGSVVLAMGVGGCAKKVVLDADRGAPIEHVVDQSLAHTEAPEESSAKPKPDCTPEDGHGMGSAECCDALRSWCEENSKADGDWAECTFGMSSGTSTGCIPWGPPVPPRFSGVARA